MQEATTAQNNRKTATMQLAVLQEGEVMDVRGIQKCVTRMCDNQINY